MDKTGPDASIMLAVGKYMQEAMAASMRGATLTSRELERIAQRVASECNVSWEWRGSEEGEAGISFFIRKN